MFQQNILSSLIFGLKIKVFQFAPCRYIVLDMWLLSLPDEIPFRSSCVLVFLSTPHWTGAVSHLSLLDSSPCFLSCSLVDQPSTHSFSFFCLYTWNGQYTTRLSDTHSTLRPSFASWPIWRNLRCWEAFDVSSQLVHCDMLTSRVK